MYKPIYWSAAADGYKRQEPKSPARAADGPNPIKFVIDSGLARDFSQGALRATNATFDLAIDGPGFFRIQTPGGDRFTRDGHFRLDDTGRIVTQSGQPVLDSGGAEVIIDPKKGTVEIARDGSMHPGIEQVLSLIPLAPFTPNDTVRYTGSR